MVKISKLNNVGNSASFYQKWNNEIYKLYSESTAFIWNYETTSCQYDKYLTKTRQMYF